jgi:hypothetical protein
MKLDQVRVVAKSLGVNPGKLAKAELIKSIQLAEGNFDCFASAMNGACNQMGCVWREDCFDTARKGFQS